MSMESKITALAAAVRDKINTIMPRLLPAGGNSGQVLTKNSSADNDTGWVDQAAGGGEQQVYVQETRPVATGPWLWWVVDGSGNIINLIINDGV